MTVGINKDIEGEISDYLQKYIDILKHNKIEYKLLDINDYDFWDKVKKIDFFIHRWENTDDHAQRTQTFLPVIEKYLKIKCYPDLNSCWHYDDKVKQYLLLSQLGYPVVQSWIFWEKDKAIELAVGTTYPVVFKLKRGASSTGVRLIKSQSEAVKIINKIFGRGIKPGNQNKVLIFLGNKLKKIRKQVSYVPNYWQSEKNYAYFQKFMPDNKWDTRVYVIGKRAFASRRLVRSNDFRASGSGKDDKNPEKIDLRFVEIALKIVRELNFQSMSFDFLYDEGKKPVICEISYSMPDEPVYLMHGYWDSELNFHKGHYWPQYFHLKELLNLPDLKIPESLINKSVKDNYQVKTSF